MQSGTAAAPPPRAPPGTPRLLVNRERVGVGMFGMGGFDFDSDGTKDGFFEGDSDAAVAQLAHAQHLAERALADDALVVLAVGVQPRLLVEEIAQLRQAELAAGPAGGPSAEPV